MIAAGIPLGRKPPEPGAGALLWLEGFAGAVNIPLQCLLASLVSFFFVFSTRIQGGFGISPGFSVCGRQISSLGALKCQQEGLAQPRGFVPAKESFFAFDFGAASKQESPWKWRVASSVL